MAEDDEGSLWSLAKNADAPLTVGTSFPNMHEDKNEDLLKGHQTHGILALVKEKMKMGLTRWTTS